MKNTVELKPGDLYGDKLYTVCNPENGLHSIKVNGLNDVERSRLRAYCKGFARAWFQS